MKHTITSKTHYSMNILSLLLLLLTLIPFSSQASETSLDVSVDRTEIGKNETLNLRLSANVKMDFSFGGLMNFGRNQVEAPDTTELEKNFEIIDRQQNYSMRSINGETTSQVVWNLALAPKSSGILTIPSLKLKDAESKPIQIKVLEENAERSNENPPQAFLELSSDKSSAYVQEQILLTVRLYTQGRMSNASLTEPESTRAIIEPFGEDKKYYRMAYNQRYDVIERQYLIFPQESGELTIPALSFNGMLIDSYSRRRLRVREQSEELSIEIKPPNPSFTGVQWLPALSLHLEEHWQNESTSINVGDPVTREIKLTALGLLGSAIPPFSVTESESMKSYPDKPNVESIQHSSGSQAIRTESTTYVAIKPGIIELPEQSITWWDTANDIERTATIPSKKISVIGSSVSPQTPNNSYDPQDQINSTSQSFSPQLAETDAEPLDANLNNYNVSSKIDGKINNNGSLVALLLLTVIAWVISCFYLLKRIRHQEEFIARLTAQSSIQPPNPSIPTPKEILSAIESEHPDLPHTYIAWLSSLEGYSKISSIEDLKDLNPNIYRELKAFDAQRYSRNNQGTFNKKVLAEHTQEIINSMKDHKKQGSYRSLQPFYPR